MSKAVLSNEEMKTEGPDVVEFFSTKPVNTVPISPPPSSKQKTPKITPEPKHKANKQEKDDVMWVHIFLPCYSDIFTVCIMWNIIYIFFLNVL